MAVIAINITIVVGLLIIVPLATVAICTTVTRKRNRVQKRSHGSGSSEVMASYKKRKRPRSMLEHIQMEEDELETVDFGEFKVQRFNSPVIAIENMHARQYY